MGVFGPTAEVESLGLNTEITAMLRTCHWEPFHKQNIKLHTYIHIYIYSIYIYVYKVQASFVSSRSFFKSMPKVVEKKVFTKDC